MLAIFGSGPTSISVILSVEAIFKEGVLIPLEPLDFAEHQEVHLIVELNDPTPNSAVCTWHWQESQAIEDGFQGSVAEEVALQRREG